MTTAALRKTPDLISQLPAVRGKYRAGAELAKSTWFQVGGEAEILFKPEDAADLAYFLKNKPADVAVTILGVGSNLLVRDSGIEGVVIRLGRGFAGISAEGNRVRAGAAALDVHVAEVAAQCGLSGLEFLVGIPGGIGGALAMNGGAYGREVKDVLVEAQAVDSQGNMHVLPASELHYSYRHCGLPEGWIFTEATFQAMPGEKEKILARMQEITTAREDTQPIRSRTGGSTFKNPPGYKAWELVEQAGCRELTVGGAQVSPKHCNFLINTGTATAADLENLGEEVRRRVSEKTGVMLEWEIKRIGRTS